MPEGVFVLSELNCVMCCLFNSAEGGIKRKFVKFNGGFSRDQLNWLDGVLSLSDKNEERVLIVSK